MLLANRTAAEREEPREREGERAESVSLPVCQPGSEFELCITYRGGAAAVAEERTERLSLTFVKDGRGRSSHHRRVSGCVCVCVCRYDNASFASPVRILIDTFKF